MARKTSGRIHTVVEMLVTVAVALAVAYLIQALLVKPYRIPSGSMLPTIHIGQRVFASRVSTHPALGAIVVFHPPAGANPEPAICANPQEGVGDPAACDVATRARSQQTFIKRVVGLPGDRISIHDGTVIRDGHPEHAPYAQPCPDASDCDFPHTIVIPKNHYYLMGDNRDKSDDSRFWGPIPQSWIIGTAIATYWPPDRIGTL